jgi:hypothetical protein
MSDEKSQADALKESAEALVSGTAADVISALPEVKDKELLESALVAERAGKERVTVIDALTKAITPVVEPKAPVEAKEGHVFMKAPQDASAASVDGVEYLVDEDGHVEVPRHAQALLHPHGFVTKVR